MCVFVYVFNGSSMLNCALWFLFNPQCWQNCQRQLAPFELRVHHAQRQGALVLTDIGWDELIANASRQCLITWEVSGGGLMGNLLTDTARAELSLWPDTVYNIQVTCKHKVSKTLSVCISEQIFHTDPHTAVFCGRCCCCCGCCCCLLPQPQLIEAKTVNSFSFLALSGFAANGSDATLP